MRKIMLDTSFILSCVREKIDFFEKLNHEGFEIIVPMQAINELNGLGASTALKILEINRKNFRVMNIPGKDADTAILKFAKREPLAVIATLDQGLQKKLKNKKMIIRARKKLEII